MNVFQSSRRQNAFTLVELLVVIAIIAILAALLLPVLTKGQLRAKRVWCENNLQQTGTGFHLFMHDHNGQFPMGVSTNEGGSQEFVQAGYFINGEFYFSFHSFQSLSAELVTPNILICPTDTRLPAANFAKLKNENVSYFTGVNADFSKPNSVLSGDRNLATNSLHQPTILRIEGGSRLHWTRELHEFKGNVLFSDNHVEEWNNSTLAAANSSVTAGDLFLPSVKPGPSQPGFAGSGGAPGSSARMPAAGTPGANPSQNTSKPPPAMSGSRPNRPPDNSFGNHKAFNESGSPAGSQNSHVKIETVPAVADTWSNAPVVRDGMDPAMSTFDQHVVKTLRHAFEWSYFLLLLLLLLFLAYKLWRWAQRRKEQRERQARMNPENPA